MIIDFCSYINLSMINYLDMITVKLLLWIIAYTVGIVRFSITSIILIKNRKIQDIWELLFFIVFTALLISLANIETMFTLNNKGSSIFSMIAMYSCSLLILTLPVHVHYTINELRGLKFRNRLFSVISFICIILLTIYFAVRSDILYAISSIVTYSLMTISVSYSMILLILDDRKKPWKDKYKLPIIALIIIPGMMFIDLILLKREYFIMFPIFYIMINSFKMGERILQLNISNADKGLCEKKMDAFSLTKREREVTKLLLTGMTYYQIADNLCISLPTVKTHVFRIYAKTNSHSKMDLLKLYGNNFSI